MPPLLLALLLSCASSSPGDTAAPCGDLDCDGWPDLVLARTQDEEGSYDVPSLVYYGGPEGLSAPVELPTAGAMGAAIADLDQDGFFEVVIAQATSDGRDRLVDSLVFRGTARGPDPADPVRLPTIGAADVEAVDVDEDGWLDLLFANRYAGGDVTEEAYTNPSRIYWGGPEGFDATVVTELLTIGAAQGAVADLDGDGRKDVAFAHGTVFDAESRVYRATGDRSFEEWVRLPTVFTEGVTAADADRDGWTDLLYANWCGGTECDSTLYLGGPEGFSADRSLPIQGQGAVDTAIVDLDGDGFHEIVVANSFDEGFDPDVESVVYHGSAEGWSVYDRTRLPTPGAGAVAVGDLDRDGHPELVFPGYYGVEGTAAATPIYRGSAQGYDEAAVDWLEAAGAAAAALTPNAAWQVP